jgi:hypothetical protein
MYAEPKDNTSPASFRVGAASGYFRRFSRVILQSST